MKTEKNILIAFILNMAFSVFELLGGIFTGSIAIISDALHDAGDALSIGISYFLERKSHCQPDEKYTYGYTRYSLLGSVITTLILIFGSAVVIYNAINKIFSPSEINYDGMIVFAIIGTGVNLSALFFTSHGSSLNQKAVSLHMLEDAIGWIIVLIGAVVMRFTDLYVLDPLMSLALSVFILVNAVKTLKEATAVFLEQAPCGIKLSEISNAVKEVDGVLDVHHIHVWSMDGEQNYATMHIVTNSDFCDIKKKVRHKLLHMGISHTTLEIEKENEVCHHKHCHMEIKSHSHHHHHHH